MWMPDACEPIDEQWPPFADAFREIHRFILKAKDGNAAAANALFQKYLNGELTDELLRISRCWVQEEQACAPNRSSEGATIGVADPQVSGHVTPVRPVERRSSKQAAFAPASRQRLLCETMLQHMDSCATEVRRRTGLALNGVKRG
jgi:hypothetical protein